MRDPSRSFTQVQAFKYFSISLHLEEKWEQFGHTSTAMQHCDEQPSSIVPPDENLYNVAIVRGVSKASIRLQR